MSAREIDFRRDASSRLAAAPEGSCDAQRTENDAPAAANAQTLPARQRARALAPCCLAICRLEDPCASSFATSTADVRVDPDEALLLPWRRCGCRA